MINEKGKVGAQGRLVVGSDVEWFVGCKGPVSGDNSRPNRVTSCAFELGAEGGAGCVVAAPSPLSGRRADDHRYPPLSSFILHFFLSFSFTHHHHHHHRCCRRCCCCCCIVSLSLPNRADPSTTIGKFHSYFPGLTAMYWISTRLYPPSSIFRIR